MKNRNKKFFSLCFFFLCLFFIGKIALALEIHWPTSPGGTSLTDLSTIPDLVKYFYEWGIALGGVAAFYTLIIAGFQYLTSTGQPGVMKEAREKIISAILGLILLLSSWLILTTINPRLTGYQPPPEGSGEIEPMSSCPPFVSLSSQCEYALVYKGKNWKGEWKQLELGRLIEFSPLSVESYYFENMIENLNKAKKTCGNNTNCQKECYCTYACNCDNKMTCEYSPAGCSWQNGFCVPDCSKNCSWCYDETSCNSRMPHCHWYQGRCNTSCGENACGCLLELAGEKKTGVWCWLGICETVCGDVYNTIQAYNSDITEVTDKYPYCIRLKSPASNR